MSLTQVKSWLKNAVWTRSSTEEEIKKSDTNEVKIQLLLGAFKHELINIIGFMLHLGKQHFVCKNS